MDYSQNLVVVQEIDGMLERAREDGLPEKYWPLPEGLANGNTNIFRASFLSGSPDRLPPLRVTVSKEASIIRVMFRNYSQEQCEFLRLMTDALLEAGLMYTNPTSRWASAPLLRPKPGSDKWRFTVEIIPVNRFTHIHHYPMPRIELELSRL